MSAWRLVCPECGGEDIKQFGHVEAAWGGEAWVELDDEGKEVGEREWQDDGDGADMYWDAYEITSYHCLVCDHDMKSLNELTTEEVEDD